MIDKKRQKKGFDIGDLISVVWRRKWIIIIPLILVTAATFAGSYLITPEYESSVIVWIGNPVKLSTDLQRLLGNGRQNYRSSQDRQLELKSLQNEITSSPYLSQLVSILKLDNDPKLEEQAVKVRSTRPDLSLEQIKFDFLIKKLREKIVVSYAGKDQIQIVVQSTEPYMARDMAQNLGEIFISEKMKEELGSVRLSQDFSYEQLAKYDKDLTDRVAEKTAFEKEFMKIKLDDLVTSDENRTEISSEIQATNFEINDKKDEETGIIGQLASLGVPRNQIKLTESSDLRGLKRDVDNLIESIATLMQKYRWSDPEILNFNARMYNLIGQIGDEIEVLVDDQFSDYPESTRKSISELYVVRADLDVLYSRVNNLRLALDDLNNKINLGPEYEARLDQLEREVSAARDLRDKFKEQQESSQISQALLRESKHKVIEPAKVPLEPFKPQRSKIAILGILLGLAIGAGAALLAEVMDTSFKNLDDIENSLGYPVIGVVPEITFLKKIRIKS